MTLPQSSPGATPSSWYPPPPPGGSDFALCIQYLIVGGFVPQPGNKGFVEGVPRRAAVYQLVDTTALARALGAEPSSALVMPPIFFSSCPSGSDGVVAAKTEPPNMSHR